MTGGTWLQLSQLGPDADAARLNPSMVGGNKKYGTILGVLFPNLQNILGVILFIRLPWIVGQAGIGWSMVIVAISECTVLLTALSVCAIVTNGTITDGGLYHLAYRSLGPEYGLVSGILYFLANSLVPALYILGAAEILLETVIKVGPGLLFFAALAVLAMWIGILAGDPPAKLEAEKFRVNFAPGFTDGNTILATLALFYPSVTDPLGATSYSGDLKYPAKSIPIGTILSILITSSIYLISIVLFGSSITRSMLIENRYISTQVAWLSDWIVVIGVIFASMASALQSLAGAPRILAAIAKDNIIPILKPFAKVNQKNGEPTRATFMTFAIAVAAVMAGNLDHIAPLVTMCYLMVYMSINFATFISDFLKAPGWRPRWKYFHWSISLLAALVCVVTMLFLSWYSALAVIALSSGIWFYVHITRDQAVWGGSALRSYRYEQALSNLLALSELPMDATNWRPQFLAIIHLDESRNFQVIHPNMLSFLRQLRAGRGLFMVSTVLNTRRDREELDRETVEKMDKAQIKLTLAMKEAHIKGFVEVTANQNYFVGIEYLLQTCGLGDLRPNCLVLEYPTNLTSSSADSLIKLLALIKAQHRTVLFLKGVSSFPDNECTLTGTIDIWWISYNSGIILLLPFLLKRTSVWRRTQLRVFTAALPHEDRRFLERELKGYLKRLRIDARVEVVGIVEEELGVSVEEMNGMTVGGGSLGGSENKDGAVIEVEKSSLIDMEGGMKPNIDDITSDGFEGTDGGTKDVRGASNSKRPTVRINTSVSNCATSQQPQPGSASSSSSSVSSSPSASPSTDSPTTPYASPSNPESMLLFAAARRLNAHIKKHSLNADMIFLNLPQPTDIV
ncbi:hypothetical protein HK102_009787, partial [Quaeritorhiza haematococci]